MGGDAWVMGSWPSAGAAAPRVKPPANVAPLFRSSRRFKRFEPIGLSFADEPQEIADPKSKVYARLRAQSSKSGVSFREVVVRSSHATDAGIGSMDAVRTGLCAVAGTGRHDRRGAEAECHHPDKRAEPPDAD